MCVSRRGQMVPTKFLLLLLLVGLCAATEYYVKPTKSQESSYPRESGYTLDELAAKYFYASATDVLTDNVTVKFLNGTHELKGSIFVTEVKEFTLLGAGGMIAESHVEINCKGASSLVFEGIINLTITRITFSQCGVLHQNGNLYLPLQAPHVNALTFSDVFNLRLTWVVIQNSTINGILVANVLGTSVIQHSVFQSFNDSGLQNHYYNNFENPQSRHIFIGYSKVCYMCRNKIEFNQRDVKLHIHNCVLRDGRTGSMRILLYHDGYNVELDLMNVSALNGGDVDKKGDISINNGRKANYVVTIRDSYIGNSKGAAITVEQRQMKANLSQLIHITNSIIDKSAAGIVIHHYTSAGIKGITNISQIIIENGIITNIRGTGELLYGGGLRITTFDEQPQLSVVLNNVSFTNNTFPLNGGIKLYFLKGIFEMIDCEFVGNQGTPITLDDSTLNVSGTISFVNNTAHQGGAMAFYGESYIVVSFEKNTQIYFKNNYAEHVGGAIFVEDPENQRIQWPIGNRLCFLQLTTHYSKCSDFKNNPHLIFVFTNNTAHNGGDAIYGSSLHLCIAGKCRGETILAIPIVGAYIFIDNYWNLVKYNIGHQSNLSLISSVPSRVCLCEDGEPDCLTMFANDTHYPGETFSISAVVVGQGFGTVDGTVYAQFTNKDTPRLKELQQSQQVEHSSCTNLKYTVFSANDKETLVLSARTTLLKNDPELVSFVIQKHELVKRNPYKMYQARHYLDDLLKFDIFINITLLPCPPGFILSDQPAKCVCHTTLQLHNITCNIDDQTVHRGGTVWVNASFAGKKSNGVIVHHHCPYGYCNLEELDIKLDFPDTQCNFNHSGILCGGCRPGLSLTLGTSQCLRCSNKYIAFLIPFAIAGILLIALIKFLNLTVSEGTLNGLIFYANIIRANQATFFPSTSTHCPVLTVFIAWLNLDLGIETCFIEGLNGYWKTWLQFVFPAYIWIITAVIIVVAHYSSTGARFFGSNSVQVLATLFLLSYTKLLRTIIIVISFTFLDYPDHCRKTVWLYDGNIPYLSPAHTPLFLVALTVFILLWLPYTVVLLLVQYLRKKTHLRLLYWFTKLKPLFDAYLGPFKDKHCYWVGVLLLVRILLLIISAVNPNNAPKVNLLAIGGTTLVLLAYTATAGKVYRKKYVSFLENSFLLNLGALAIGTLYTGGNGQGHTAVVHTLVGIAFLQFVGIIFFHGYCSIKETRSWRHVTARFTLARCTDEDDRNLNYQPFEAAQPVRQRMIFNELNEPIIENADDSM